MFDVSWSELLILAVVTLVCVKPKDLPVVMRTLGRYAGAARRQANEFRRHFDDAMREAELDTIKKEFETMQASVNAEVMNAEGALASAAPPPPGTGAAPPAVAPSPSPSAPQPALPMPPMPAPPGREH